MTVKSNIKNVYVVHTTYFEFDDLDNNYSLVDGVYKTKSGAMKIIKARLEEEKELEMVFSEAKHFEDEFDMLERVGYIELEQVNGYGRVRLFLDRKEMK